MLELKYLNKQGERVVKTCDRVPVRKYRDYLELQVALADETLTEMDRLDKQLAFMASLFDGVTADDLLDGLTTKEMADLSAEIFIVLVGVDPDSEGK